jgi:hypothetical protein
MAKQKVGTSDFSYQDDLGAELHPTNPDHHEAAFHGGRVPPKTELQEVVLGPPAFGSPDPRTLGHNMLPAGNEQTDSAPDISEDYADGRPLFNKVSSAHEEDASTGSGEEAEKTWKKSDNKADLLAEARSRGLDVTEENTKEEITTALEEDDAAADDDDDDDDNAGGDNDDDENQ